MSAVQDESNTKFTLAYMITLSIQRQLAVALNERYIFHSGLWRSVARQVLLLLCIIPSYSCGNLKFRFIMLKKRLNRSLVCLHFYFSVQPFEKNKRRQRQRYVNIFIIVIYVFIYRTSKIKCLQYEQIVCNMLRSNITV